MFEDIVKTQADRDLESLEELSPQDVRARRLAAGILTAYAVLAVTKAAMSGRSLPFLALILSLVLAWFLFRLHPRAVPLTLSVAVLAAVAYSLRDHLEIQRRIAWHGGLDVQQGIALSEALRIWGVMGALLLLLAGEAGRRRQSLAVILFVITSTSHPLVLINTRESPEPPVSDLQYFRSITSGIRRAESLKLYAGLPHQMFAREDYESELATKKTVEFHGYHFYEKPLTPSTEQIEGLRRVVTASESYRRHTIKPCGGFHPDYALIWEDRGRTYGVLLCFGCQEALLFEPEQELMLSLGSRGPGSVLSKYLG